MDEVEAGTSNNLRISANTSDIRSKTPCRVMMLDLDPSRTHPSHRPSSNTHLEWGLAQVSGGGLGTGLHLCRLCMTTCLE